MAGSVAAERGDQWISRRASALGPLDDAVDYMRRSFRRLAPYYLVASAPLAAVSLFLIDAIASGRRSLLPAGCALLAGATVWRWIGLAALQRQVQADCRGEAPLPLAGRIADIVVARLFVAILLTWGGFLIAPGIIGFFLAGFVAPMALESHGSLVGEFGRLLGLIAESMRRLTVVLAALFAMLLIAMLTTFTAHLLLLMPLISESIGLNVPEVELTFASRSWMLSVGLFLFLIFDFYWSIASVILFYDLQSRRFGNDVRLRLSALRESQT